MRIWEETEIRKLIEANTEVLYRALKRIYAKQTAEERSAGETLESNGVGFNGADSPFMSSLCEHLLRYGRLSEKQIAIARSKLRKYSRQLTQIANEIERQKCLN